MYSLSFKVNEDAILDYGSCLTPLYEYAQQYLSTYFQGGKLYSV